MRAKIVVRLLDGEGTLLGWTSLLAEAPGDATLRHYGDCSVVVARDGVATTLSYHWAELNVEARVPMPLGPTPVSTGQILHVVFTNGIVIKLELPSEPLPPVTVGGPVMVGVPSGGSSTTAVPAAATLAMPK